jgi:hypothetical protein
MDMALWDDLRKNAVTGLFIGIGAAVVAPVVVPILTSIAKPLTKTLIKQGFVLYERGKEKLAETKEVLEDLVAEAKAEMDAEMLAASSMAAGGAMAASQEPVPGESKEARDQNESLGHPGQGGNTP